MKLVSDQGNFELTKRLYFLGIDIRIFFQDRHSGDEFVCVLCRLVLSSYRHAFSFSRRYITCILTSYFYTHYTHYTVIIQRMSTPSDVCLNHSNVLCSFLSIHIGGLIRPCISLVQQDYPWSFDHAGFDVAVL